MARAVVRRGAILMLIRVIQGLLLLALTVAMHAFVLGSLLKHVQESLAALPTRFGSQSRLLIRVAAVTVLAHLAEIALWAAFFVWKEALATFELAFYFSAVTYATIGYGDVVLPEPWRLLAAMEGLTGILMCGWSAAFYFAVVTRLVARSR
jgi:voltage-gated potassium channel